MNHRDKPTDEEQSFFSLMINELDHQNRKFPGEWIGLKFHTNGYHVAVSILAEEVGELAQAILKGEFASAKDEALQVATVAMRIHQILCLPSMTRQS